MLTIKGKIPLYAMMIMIFLLLYAILAVYFNYKYANIEAPGKAPAAPANGPANASNGAIPRANGSAPAYPDPSLNNTNPDTLLNNANATG